MGKYTALADQMEQKDVDDKEIVNEKISNKPSEIESSEKDQINNSANEECEIVNAEDVSLFITVILKRKFQKWIFQILKILCLQSKLKKKMN